MLTFIQTILAGLVGTVLMSITLTFVHRTGWADADMIRAVGSLYTKKYENSLIPGLLIHAASGIVFAFPYTIVMRALDVPVNAAMPAIGFGLGLFHGVAMSYVMLAAVSESHPVERFRDPGFGVAVAHIVAHLAYGLGVGTIVYLLHIDFGIRF